MQSLVDTLRTCHKWK